MSEKCNRELGDFYFSVLLKWQTWEQSERSFMQEFVQKQIKSAKIEASEDYKRFLPPVETPAAK